MKQFVYIVSLIFLSQLTLGQGSFAPSAGQFGSTAIHKDSSIFVSWIEDCQITRGYQQINDSTLGKATQGDSIDANNKADGVAVSLGDGGEAVIKLAQPIFNGPGADFAVFENGFSATFLELGFVEVSSDGIHFFRFPATSETQYVSQIGTFGSVDATYIHNLAGKYHVFYGTPFDLDELPSDSLLNKFAITHLKIIDVVGNISQNYARHDTALNVINDPWPTPFASSGFDLDAVGLIHVNGINSVKERQKETLTLFPNPIDNQLNIQVDSPITGIEFISVTGKIIPFSNASNLDVSQLPAGVYFVRITTQNHQYVKKVVKK